MLIFSLLGRPPTGDVSHNSSNTLPLLSSRPAVTFPASELHPLWLRPVIMNTFIRQQGRTQMERQIYTVKNKRYYYYMWKVRCLTILCCWCAVVFARNCCHRITCESPVLAFRRFSFGFNISDCCCWIFVSVYCKLCLLIGCWLFCFRKFYVLFCQLTVRETNVRCQRLCRRISASRWAGGRSNSGRLQGSNESSFADASQVSLSVQSAGL